MGRKGVPRATHKEGCMCVVCKAKRAKMEREAVEPEVVSEPKIVVPPAPPPPVEVRLDSLPIAAKFEYKGAKCQVNDKVEGMIVCYNLFLMDTMTLGGSTMVEPIE